MNGQFYYDAGDFILFTDYDSANIAGIFRYNVNTEVVDAIFDGYGWSFVVHDGWLYFAGNPGLDLDYSYELYRCRLDGSDLQFLQSGYHYGVTIYNGQLYYVREDADGVMNLCRSQLDGSGEQILQADSTGIYTIYQDTLYYISQDYMLCQTSPNFSGNQVIVEDATFFIIGQNQFVYIDWVGNVYRCALDGSGQTMLVEDPTYQIYYGLLVWRYHFLYHLDR